MDSEISDHSGPSGIESEEGVLVASLLTACCVAVSNFNILVDTTVKSVEDLLAEACYVAESCCQTLPRCYASASTLTHGRLTAVNASTSRLLHGAVWSPGVISGSRARTLRAKNDRSACRPDRLNRRALALVTRVRVMTTTRLMTTRLLKLRSSQVLKFEMMTGKRKLPIGPRRNVTVDRPS